MEYTISVDKMNVPLLDAKAYTPDNKSDKENQAPIPIEIQKKLGLVGY